MGRIKLGRVKCKKCGIDFLLYSRGESEFREVTECFICSDCLEKSWCEFGDIKMKYKELVDSGVDPIVADRMMSEIIKRRGDDD